MEGTVSIKLNDFLELKRKADRYDSSDTHYLKLATKYIFLLEEVEKFLKIEHGCMDHPTLLRKVDEVLSEWFS